MEKINITIDGQQIQVAKTATVLEAAAQAGVKIPSLCYHPELRPEGCCRVCMVEVQGAKTLVPACVYPVNEGMVVRTNTPAVREARKVVVELMLANHPQDCLTCQRNQNCELQSIAGQLGIREIPVHGAKKNHPLDANNPSLVRDQNKCILCGRCIRACSERQGVHVYTFAERGFNTIVAPAFNVGLEDAACTYCGQCASVCPTAAIVEKDDTDAVYAAIADPQKHVVIQTSPATRVAFGEEVGYEPGSIVTGKMVAALRRLGFDKVFDTDFTADLTILEEGNEFIKRVTEGGVLPMITSCSPGWINFCELMYPDLLDHLSSCKSPQGMFGALVKTYYAEKAGIDPKDIVSVSMMPCTAKKAECVRPELRDSGYQDVDYVLTTREIGRMVRQAGIEVEKLPVEDYDAPLGITTGAAVIFGTTGGVMEAALRTVVEVVTGKPLDNINFTVVRGLEGIKEASLQVTPDLTVNVAVAHTLANARILMDQIRKGESKYHFIEIMACPGGCIGGGGQPVPVDADIRLKRNAAIYECDECMTIRKSHENPAIKELYDTWLGKPLGHKSHELLHTTYKAQSNRG